MILKKLKCCMQMESGTKDNCPCPVSISLQKVQFYDDNETTEVNFSDKDVRLIQ